jgi:hypothetical protein
VFDTVQGCQAHSIRNRLKLEPSSVLGFIAVEPDDHEGGEPMPAFALPWIGKGESIVH